MARSTYDLARENNAALKGLLDTIVSLNAERRLAESQGWTVFFIVQNGDVDVTISRDKWPALAEQSA